MLHKYKEFAILLLVVLCLSMRNFETNQVLRTTEWRIINSSLRLIRKPLKHMCYTYKTHVLYAPTTTIIELH